MLRIVADDKIPFLKGILEPFAGVTYIPGKDINREVAAGADALLIRTRTRCDASLLAGTPVKFIGTATIGYDHIDCGFCENAGITWTNAPGCNASSVMQYMASALISVSKEKKMSLEGKTLGIIGAGHVGSQVETLAGLLGMKVLLNDPPRARREGCEKFTELNRLLERSDFVTMHVPLTMAGDEKTYHLMDTVMIGMMKPDAWLINTSRGEVVDSAALDAALSMGEIAGAILDVWEDEPKIDFELLRKVFIGTPHIAGYSADGKANGTSRVVRALCAHFGLPLVSWYPENLPEPLNNASIRINDLLTEDAAILHAILHTYDIRNDCTRLRENPADFEKLRNYYPVRREFQAYTVTGSNLKPAVKDKLVKLGFKVS